MINVLGLPEGSPRDVLRGLLLLDKSMNAYTLPTIIE